MKSILITSFFLILFATPGTAQYLSIEPPHWWTGMRDPGLQIMLSGIDFSKLKIVSNDSRIKILKTSSPGSSNYLFVDLNIKRNAKPGNIHFHIKYGDTIVLPFDYMLHEREEKSSSRQGFNSSDAIYLITPDRFANGDVKNDFYGRMKEGPARDERFGRHGGDLEGIRQRLDYISNLGFTSIWLNPVLENNMPRASYHGYATTDYYKVDPRFGTNESYKQLCQEASGKGIKMIMDMITNHIGLEHKWMIDPPTKDWINYFQQPYIETNHRKTISMDPYASKSDADVLTKGWFVRTMPDLNVTNPYLGKYLIQNAIWWIEYAGLAGIRLDTYLYPDEDYMSEWSRRIMKEYPKFNIVGEVWHDNPSIVSYWQKGKKNVNGYVSHLPSLFDFPVKKALIESLSTEQPWEDSWMPLYETVAEDFQYADPHNLVVFTDNHDIDRTFTALGEDVAKLKNALAYIFTTRGIPQIFYGTEILMTNKNRNDHGEIRSDFPGGWEKDPVDAVSGKGLTQSQKETQAYMSRILNWRKTADVIHNGNMMHFIPMEDVYVFFRYKDNKKVMVILNQNKKPVTLSLNRFEEMLKGHSRGTEIITGEKIKLDEELALMPEEPMIIEMN